MISWVHAEQMVKKEFSEINRNELYFAEKEGISKANKHLLVTEMCSY